MLVWTAVHQATGCCKTYNICLAAFDHVLVFGAFMSQTPKPH